MFFVCRHIFVYLFSFCSKNGVLRGVLYRIDSCDIRLVFSLAQFSDAFSRDEDIARSPASLGFRLKISVES